jgi:hypothetical protein
MIQAPQIEAVSTLSRDYRRIFAKLNAGPVFLAHRSKAIAALVSIEEWNKIVALLDEQQDLIDVLEAELELASGADSLIDGDIAELEKLGHGNPIPA